MSWLRLRQVVLAVRDLEPTVAAIRAALGIEISLRDPAVAEFGLHNAVMPVGDTFLEVVSPVRDDAPARRFLDRQGGDFGYMVMLQTDALGDAEKRFADRGVRTVWRIELDDIRDTHFHPRDVGGAILALDEATPRDSWRWAGPEWSERMRTERVREITAVELGARDRDALAGRWADLLDRPLRDGDDDTVEIGLDRGRIRFVTTRPGEPEGVTGFDVATVDAGAVRDAARAAGLTVDDRGFGIARVRVGLE